MNIEKGMVVTIEYTLKDETGSTWESSQNDEPWVYLHGFGGIIPGLEGKLDGKTIGDKLSVTLAPEESYGAYENDLANEVPKDAFAGIEELKEGMRLSAQTDDGQTHAVTVTKITDETVTVDANHPLAGQTVTIDVEVSEIRAATQEEMDHGHAHSGDGHHH